MPRKLSDRVKEFREIFRVRDSREVAFFFLQEIIDDMPDVLMDLIVDWLITNGVDRKDIAEGTEGNRFLREVLFSRVVDDLERDFMTNIKMVIDEESFVGSVWEPGCLRSNPYDCLKEDNLYTIILAVAWRVMDSNLDALDVKRHIERLNKPRGAGSVDKK